MVNIGNIGELDENISEHKIEWPEKSNFSVCLTHDVDRVRKTYQYLTHLIKKRNIRQFHSLFNKKETYWQFNKIMEIEKDLGVRSTFFFLNESIKFNPFSISNWKFSLGRYNIQSKTIVNLIRELDKGGWEIGMHGSILSYNNLELLREEKEVLEKIVNHKIRGIRQHWLNLEIPLSWKLHKQIGLTYDASFGLKYGVGYKDNKFWPFSPFNDDFVVFPLSIMDTYIFSISDNYDDAWKIAKSTIDQAEENRGLLTILWHQRKFSESNYPKHCALYKKIVKECINRSAWFGTCGEIHDYLSKNRNITNKI